MQYSGTLLNYATYVKQMTSFWDMLVWRKDIITQNIAATLTDPLSYFINMSLIKLEFYKWKSVHLHGHSD